MVGIIILNYMAYRETINCVHSIFKSSSEDITIYIVDNNSPNDSFNILKEEFSGFNNIKLVKNNINSGYSAGNNIGIKMALEDECDTIIISNSDIIFHENSIEEMVRFLKENPNIGVIGPKVLDSSNNLALNTRIMTKTGIKEKIFARTRLRELNLFNLYNTHYGFDKPYDRELEVYRVSGCCFAMSNKMALLITPFDENTFLYEEEPIIGIRAERTGLKTYYFPKAVVTHYHAASSKYIGSFSQIHFVNSEIYYLKTYMNASTLMILPIYFARVLLYLSRCVSNNDYRKNIGKFFIESQKRLWSKNGLG
nr:glycosyltransferase family 2 protein [Neobacillus sp. Marseille-Q6967]